MKRIFSIFISILLIILLLTNIIIMVKLFFPIHAYVYLSDDMHEDLIKFLNKDKIKLVKISKYFYKLKNCKKSKNAIYKYLDEILEKKNILSHKLSSSPIDEDINDIMVDYKLLEFEEKKIYLILARLDKKFELFKTD